MAEPKKRKRRGERADGRIQVTYTDGLRPDGKPNRISFYGATRKEAEEKRERYIRIKEQGIDVDAANITLNQWIDKYIETYRPKMEYTKSHYAHLREDCGKMKLSAVREAHLADSVLRHCETSAKQTAQRYIGVIKNVFKKAKKNKLIIDDPSEDLRVPETTTEGSHRALERFEIDAIIDNWQIIDAGLWCLLMLTTGMRRGEMMALNWTNVDMKKRVIHIGSTVVFDGQGKMTYKDGTKTKAGIRDVPLCAVAFDALDQIPTEERVGMVCKHKGEPLKKYSWYSIKKFCDKLTDIAGQPILFTAHDLRHTYATMLYDSGVDVKSAQYFLGHSSLTLTLSLYTHLSQERKIASSETIASHLDSLLKRA